MGAEFIARPPGAENTPGEDAQYWNVELGEERRKAVRELTGIIAEAQALRGSNKKMLGATTGIEIGSGIAGYGVGNHFGNVVYEGKYIRIIDNTPNISPTHHISRFPANYGKNGHPLIPPHKRNSWYGTYNTFASRYGTFTQKFFAYLAFFGGVLFSAAIGYLWERFRGIYKRMRGLYSRFEGALSKVKGWIKRLTGRFKEYFNGMIGYIETILKKSKRLVKIGTYVKNLGYAIKGFGVSYVIYKLLTIAPLIFSIVSFFVGLPSEVNLLQSTAPADMLAQQVYSLVMKGMEELPKVAQTIGEAALIGIAGYGVGKAMEVGGAIVVRKGLSDLEHAAEALKNLVAMDIGEETSRARLRAVASQLR